MLGAFNVNISRFEYHCDMPMTVRLQAGAMAVETAAMVNEQARFVS